MLRLADALRRVKETVKFCEVCFNVSEGDRCRICSDVRRDQATICVVEESKDVVAIEQTREFRGLYHVLGGAISPIDGIGPNEIKIRELCLRLADGTVTEVILATDPNLEGEATATYLSRLLLPMGVKVDVAAIGGCDSQPGPRNSVAAQLCDWRQGLLRVSRVGRIGDS